jgi:hypothetical protein
MRFFKRYIIFSHIFLYRLAIRFFINFNNTYRYGNNIIIKINNYRSSFFFCLFNIDLFLSVIYPNNSIPSLYTMKVRIKYSIFYTNNNTNITYF